MKIMNAKENIFVKKPEQRKQKTKEYTILYRERGNKQGQIFETSVTADNAKEAKEGAREDLFECYVIVSVKLSRTCTHPA